MQGIARRQRNGAFGSLAGFVQATGLHQSQAEIVLGSRQLRVEREDAPDHGLGFVRPIQVDERDCEIMERRYKIRIERDGTPKYGLGLIGFADIDQQTSRDCNELRHWLA